MTRIGAILPTKAAIWQETAYAADLSDFAFGSGETSCHVAYVEDATSRSSKTNSQDCYPSPCRSGDPQTGSTSGEERLDRTVTLAAPRSLCVRLAQNRNEKGSHSWSTNFGSSQSSHSRASRPALIPTSNVGLPALPLARSRQMRSVSILSSAQQRAALPAQPATTTPRPAANPFCPSGRLNHLNRRGVHCAPTAVLHSKDPSTCSRRS